jgi:hypothetical protein
VDPVYRNALTAFLAVVYRNALTAFLAVVYRTP